MQLLAEVARQHNLGFEEAEDLLPAAPRPPTRPTAAEEDLPGPSGLPPAEALGKAPLSPLAEEMPNVRPAAHPAATAC